MTAFEILLNKLYDSIENNEPVEGDKKVKQNPSNLFSTIREFIDASFFHGNNLSYKNKISDLLLAAEKSIKNSGHEEWTHLKFIFLENELHIIKRDRAYSDVEILKSKLDDVLIA